MAKPGTHGIFHVESPELVDELDQFWENLHTRAGSRRAFVGFDFPIGVPKDYATAAGIRDFRAALEFFGEGEWKSFYDISQNKGEVCLHRPFYPFRPGGTSHADLLDGLGLSQISQLLRRCERATPALGAASPLFWTLGGKQVGRAAIIGWRDVIAPALQLSDFKLKVWPFDGDLWDLLEMDGSVVAETYPASACVQIGLGAPGRMWSKTSQDGRRRQAEPLLSWAKAHNLALSPLLESEIENGFGSGSSGEDPFDATVGLFSMLDVLLSGRAACAPEDPDVRDLEGWILGRRFDPRSPGAV